MPLYEYLCSGCGLKFEELRSHSRAEEDASCPRCHKSAKRKMSTFRADFKKSMSDYSAMAESMAKSGGSGGSCSSCGGGSCSSCGG